MRRSAAVAVIGLMAVGSVLLWLGVPFLWIWGASQVVGSTQPSLGPIIAILLGMPATMVVVGKGLSALNRIYGELTATTHDKRVQTPWLKSMRGERDSGHPRTVLDVVMVVSVSVALGVFGFWFLVLAEGGGLPG